MERWIELARHYVPDLVERKSGKFPYTQCQSKRGLDRASHVKHNQNITSNNSKRIVTMANNQNKHTKTYAHMPRGKQRRKLVYKAHTHKPSLKGNITQKVHSC